MQQISLRDYEGKRSNCFVTIMYRLAGDYKGRIINNLPDRETSRSRVRSKVPVGNFGIGLLYSEPRLTISRQGDELMALSPQSSTIGIEACHDGRVAFSYLCNKPNTKSKISNHNFQPCSKLARVPRLPMPQLMQILV